MKILNIVTMTLLFLMSPQSHSIVMEGNQIRIQATSTRLPIWCPTGAPCFYSWSVAASQTDMGPMDGSYGRYITFFPQVNWGSGARLVSEILQLSGTPNPFTIPPATALSLSKAPFVCIYNRTNNPDQYRPFDGCVPGSALAPSPSCVLSVPPSIDIGTVPSGQTTSGWAIGTITCDGTTTVSIKMTNLAANSSTVVLDAAAGVSARMLINNADGLTGTTIPVGAGSSHPFPLEASLTTLATTPGGAYSGSAIVVATWP